MTVDQALEAIALDWSYPSPQIPRSNLMIRPVLRRGNKDVRQLTVSAESFRRKTELIEGTHLADYGGNLDGFSKTYMHVLPGMQGNNVWMTRQLSRLRALQGRVQDAENLASEATAMAEETIRDMLAVSVDAASAWWNVIWPTGTNGAQPLESHEMRHVVDFFSMAFGLCGVKGAGCDLSPIQRRQLSHFFHSELQTHDWIRATSPACDCDHHYPVPTQPSTVHINNSAAAIPITTERDKWPGLVSCMADREDHGTTGAYSAWPALAAEALCYIEGDCKTAFKLMASYVSNTFQGAFGQANAVPQLRTPPYTPFNDEPA